MEPNRLFEELVLSEKRSSYEALLSAIKEHELLVCRMMNGTYTAQEVGVCRGDLMESIWKAMWIREELEHKFKEPAND